LVERFGNVLVDCKPAEEHICQQAVGKCQQNKMLPKRPSLAE
jgi:hypothetical protein